jgi:hypothetical protein
MHESDDDLERALTGSLRQLAAIDAMASGASPEVRARLLEQVRGVGRNRRRSQMKAYALAAGLAIATSIPVWQLSTRPAVDVSVQAPAVSTEVASGFYPLRYSALPVTQGSVVRLELSPADLAALGVTPPRAPGSQRDIVMADVLVGEDGLARAVRFVRTVSRDK